VHHNVSGLMLDALAEAFRVRPALDATARGRQLREWCEGQQKEPATRRAIIWELVSASLDQPLHGPLPDELVVGVATAVLDRWTRWLDAALCAQGPPGLGASWIIENTLRLWALVLSITRYAWAVPCPTEARVDDWLPTGFDPPGRSLPVELIKDAITRGRGAGTMKSFLQKLEQQRPPDAAGRAVKPETVKDWQQGRTLPNNSRVAELAQATADPWLRLKLGIRGVVERLATFRGDRTTNRNGTLFWLLVAENLAIQMQKQMEEAAHPRDGMLRALALDDVLSMYLPPFSPQSTSEDLPFHLLEQQAVLIEVKQADERIGVIFVQAPPAGQTITLHLTLEDPAAPRR
jgi:hypothetical protein